MTIRTALNALMAKKDPQAMRIADMAMTLFKGHLEQNAKLSRLKAIGREVCRQHEIPFTKVRSRRLRECWGLYWEDGSIELHLNGGTSLFIFLHELAHHIVAHKHPRSADHGPRFVRVYAELLEEYGLVPLAGMRAACRKFKVRMA